jgi:hypothetical protein
MGMSFLVPDKLAELLQNSNINSNNLQSIAKRSKTEIRLKNHKLPNSTDRILRISVRSIEDDVSKSFMKAVYLLAQNFQQHIALAYSTFNIYYQPTDRQTEYVQDEDNDETVYASMEDAIPRKWNNDFLR